MPLLLGVRLNGPRVVGQRRAGPHDGHVSPQDVPELRKLVDAGRPDDPADPRHPGVALLGVYAAAGVLSPDRHGTKFIHREFRSVPSQPFLPEQHRPRRVQLDGQRGKEQHRREHEQSQPRKDHVHSAFPMSIHPGLPPLHGRAPGRIDTHPFFIIIVGFSTCVNGIAPFTAQIHRGMIRKFVSDHGTELEIIQLISGI